MWLICDLGQREGLFPDASILLSSHFDIVCGASPAIGQSQYWCDDHAFTLHESKYSLLFCAIDHFIINSILRSRQRTWQKASTDVNLYVTRVLYHDCASYQLHPLYHSQPFSLLSNANDRSLTASLRER